MAVQELATPEKVGHKENVIDEAQNALEKTGAINAYQENPNKKSKNSFGKLKDSLANLKETTRENYHSRSLRDSFNSDDVLLEKNMLIFLDELLKALFQKDEKGKIIGGIENALKENEKLTKEQLSEKIRDSMESSKMLTKQKDKMREMLSNDRTKDFMFNVYNFKLKEISELSKASLPSEEMNKKLLEVTSLDPVSVIKSNDNSFVESSKQTEEQSAENTINVNVQAPAQEIIRNAVRIN